MNDYTYCSDCAWLHPDSLNGPSHAAMCSQFPRKQGFGFVTHNLWDKDKPFMLCRDINGGACPLFKERQDDG